MDSDPRAGESQTKCLVQKLFILLYAFSFVLVHLARIVPIPARCWHAVAGSQGRASAVVPGLAPPSSGASLSRRQKQTVDSTPIRFGLERTHRVRSARGTSGNKI